MADVGTPDRTVTLDDAIVARTERSGPRPAGAPATTGFGTRLLRETIKGMAGTLA
ncbi:MAG: hypothetical protein JWQ58_2644 [Reyranella sp.]|nr:hypothetical protein [Reyranella sp.]